MTFGAEKTRMVWLANGGKSLRICLFTSTEYMNVTDGQTPHHGIRIASRGKKKTKEIKRCRPCEVVKTNGWLYSDHPIEFRERIFTWYEVRSFSPSNSNEDIGVS